MVEAGTHIGRQLSIHPGYPEHVIPEIEAALREQQGLQPVIELVVLSGLRIPGRFEHPPTDKKVLVSTPITTVSPEGVSQAIHDTYQKGVKIPGFQQGSFEYRIVFQQVEEESS